MKRKILSVLGVLMVIVLSTAALSACNKTPAGAESGSGSRSCLPLGEGGAVLCLGTAPRRMRAAR